jgi:hypothetical protein
MYNHQLHQINISNHYQGSIQSNPSFSSIMQLISDEVGLFGHPLLQFISDEFGSWVSMVDV